MGRCQPGAEALVEHGALVGGCVADITARGERISASNGRRGMFVSWSQVVEFYTNNTGSLFAVQIDGAHADFAPRMATG